MTLIRTWMAAAAIALAGTAQAGVIGQTFEAGLYMAPKGEGLVPGGLDAPEYLAIPLQSGPPSGVSVSDGDAATWQSATAGAGAEFGFSNDGTFSIDIDDFSLTLNLTVPYKSVAGDLVVIVDSLNPLLSLYNLVAVSDNFNEGGWQILDPANTAGLGNVATGQRLAFALAGQGFLEGVQYSAVFQFEPVLNSGPGNPNDVPEPASLALVGVALATMVHGRRARRKQR